MEIEIYCIQCGYPMEVVKEVAGSIRKAKKIVIKCTAEDCTHTETINPNKDRI